MTWCRRRSSSPISGLVCFKRLLLQSILRIIVNRRENRFAQLIQPHALRAPEVIIGAEWDTKADIWNLGCLVCFHSFSASNPWKTTNLVIRICARCPTFWPLLEERRIRDESPSDASSSNDWFIWQISFRVLKARNRSSISITKASAISPTFSLTWIHNSTQVISYWVRDATRRLLRLYCQELGIPLRKFQKLPTSYPRC